MQFQILAPVEVSQREFVEYWADRYEDKRPHLYVPHIGKPLNAARTWDLFEWKNGGPIAEKKRASIQRNYIDAKPVPPRPGNDTDLIKFIRQPGGAIWRIFWLHCHDHARYPIFDQHVYRAMKVILGGPAEIPERNPAKAEAYVREYLPFHASFRTKDKRKLDKALWSFGKHMKGRHAL